MTKNTLKLNLFWVTYLNINMSPYFYNLLTILHNVVPSAAAVALGLQLMS